MAMPIHKFNFWARFIGENRQFLSKGTTQVYYYVLLIYFCCISNAHSLKRFALRFVRQMTRLGMVRAA